MVDLSVSTIAYFFIGYSIAYGIGFLQGADSGNSSLCLATIFFQRYVRRLTVFVYHLITCSSDEELC
jgi:ammonia channel protein AmtB